MLNADTPFGRLVEVMTRLRAPGGCPWDREQTHESLLRYLVEETYEVVDTVEAGDPDELRDELGDLLLQVVFHAEIEREAGRFDIDDVCEGIVAKLVRRHPHVFGDEEAETPAEVENRWERIKAAEKAERGDERGVLSGIPRHLPGLLKAQRLTEKAGKVGFDWPDSEGVLGKLREELGELERAVRAGEQDAVKQEFGDLLFVVANLARHLELDAEAALQSTNAKFVRRFEHVERRLAELGKSPVDAPLEELDRLWEEAKREERARD
jgi:tetrapyrrole methylase family protein/MazG family protein/ATP diphosphatase